MRDDIRYEMILYWSQTDQAFLAEAPELPGGVPRTARHTRMQ
jgi:predicted RNase H-like HicB family nuclease